ncbi:MAG: xylulokinase [Spirochaetes bacterium]|nr:xylulokinase [Spirochaetota bacterium]
MGKSLFLGIDCGTQSTKVLVYDLDRKKVVARGAAPHTMVSREDGTREQEALEWVQALTLAMKGIPKALRASIHGIGVSGQQHGFVPIDRSGNPIRPVKLWCDTSTVRECGEIMAACGGEKAMIRRTGNPILPGYTASKVLWLKKHEPKAYRAMAHLLLPHDFLNFWLTGKLTMEWGDASGTGFLDVRRRAWDLTVLKAIDGKRDLRACLPPLIGPHEWAGTLSRRAASHLGLPEGVPVSAGGGDNMMGAIGTGTQEDGSLTMSLGTSGTLYGYASKPVIDPDGNLAAFCSSTGGWLPLLCTMNCTVATEQWRGFLGKSLPELERLAARAPVGSDGVVTLPFFNGERSPNLPRGRASLLGLTMGNLNEANVLRSAMESAVFGLKFGWESFQRLGLRAREIKLIGGGSKSRLWRQMTADAFEVPVVTPVEEEAAAFGASLQAAWAVGSGGKADRPALNRLLARHVRMNRAAQTKPSPRTGPAQERAYLRYKNHLAALAPLYRPE